MSKEPTNESETSIVKINAAFQICGKSKNIERIEWLRSADQDTVLKSIRHNILQRFETDADFTFTFHIKRERCFIQRPLGDLFRMSSRYLSDEIFCLHPFRHLPTPKAKDAAPASPQKSTEAQANGDRSVESTLGDLNTTMAPTKGQNQNETVSSTDNAGQEGREDGESRQGLTGRLDSQRTDLTRVGSIEREIAAGQEAQGEEGLRKESETPTICIKVDFQPGENESFTLDWRIWNNISFTLTPDTKFDDLIVQLREQTWHRLNRDGALQEKRRVFRLLLQSNLGNDRDRYTNVDGLGKSRYEHLGDFFENLSDAQLTIPVTVALHTQAGKHVEWNDSNKEKLLDQDFPPEYRYYLIGRVASARRSQRARVGTDDAASLSPCCRNTTVLGWYEEPKNKLGLYSVPTWSMNDICIGDSDYGVQKHRLPQDFELDGRYNSTPSTVAGVHKFLNSAENDETNEQLALRTPISPTVNFDQAVLEEGSLGIEQWPEGNIEVTGLFIDYIGNVDTEFLTVPCTFDVKVREQDDLDDIHELLDAELRKGIGRDKTKTAVEKLLRRRSKTWRYDLWTLPQERACTKLLRYGKGKLTKFMRMVPKGKEDRALYTEAHLVPMEVDEPGPGGESGNDRSTSARARL